MPLSDAKIRNLRPTDKPYKVADFDGLFLLVKRSGAKSLRFKYRKPDKEKLLVLGDYPAITFAQAPDAAIGRPKGCSGSPMEQNLRKAGSWPGRSM
jgi:hypothetical protein